MIQICDKAKCCGCHGCYNICPKQAITMQEDDKGFKYPVIDREKCIDCGLCEKVCPILNENNTENRRSVYACYNKDEKVRLESTSGGVFTLIAEYVLENNGIIYGASFDNDFSVKHIKVSNKNELYKLRTSKYVQSEIGDTYKQVKEFLDEGKYVLFTGTPCQINGLKNYLRKDYSNLITQDIICHGVPSKKVWNKYLKYRKEKDLGEVKSINFRQKDNIGLK